MLFRGTRSCIRFQSNDASHKAPNILFNVGNLGSLGGHCLSKRLDAIFDPCRDLLLHRTCAKFCSFTGREPLGDPKFEEEAGAYISAHFVPSLTRSTGRGGKTTKLGCRHLDKAKPEALVNGETPCTFEQEMALGPKWLRVTSMVSSTVCSPR